MLHENNKTYIEITEEDLPLHCPMPDMQTWDSHPRVFLDIEEAPEQKIICPYCSTEYKLVHYRE